MRGMSQKTRWALIKALGSHMYHDLFTYGKYRVDGTKFARSKIMQLILQ